MRLLEPSDTAELLTALGGCRQPPIVLGRGTNVVGSDSDGLTALRLSPQRVFAAMTPMGHGHFTVGSAITLSKLLNTLAQQGYGGAAALSGIPGTLGGALAMNAGALGQEIASFVVAMHGLDRRNGRPWIWHAAEGGWGYRTSPVPPEIIVTQAMLRFNPVVPEEEQAQISQERARRRKVTPNGFSAGSVFRNPAPDLPAGKLLELAGCKGMNEGTFTVSEKHANWIVNLSGEGGSAADCRRLADRMAAAVTARCGIALQSEWRWLA